MFVGRSRQRVRPSSNFELYGWFFLRVSGIILLLIAVFHLLYMHVSIGVENLDFQNISARWNSPFWRVFDFTLLSFALSHGTIGTLQVMDDYVHSRGWRVVTRTAIYIVAFVLVAMGAYVIFNFKTTP